MTFFELKTAQDLIEKAKTDFAALKESSGDSRLAFNFFVTVEHIPDWLGRRAEVKADPILRIVSHIANGGKHLTLTDKRHKSVAKTERDRVFEEGVFEEGVFYEPLVVWLTAEEENALGVKKLDVVELGAMALGYWMKNDLT